MYKFFMTVLTGQILSAEMPGNLLYMLVTLRAELQMSKRQGKKTVFLSKACLSIHAERKQFSLRTLKIVMLY